MAFERKYFGTDGVRGVYGSDTMNEDVAWRFGAAAAMFVLEAGAAQGAAVIIGRDTRSSGGSLERALAGGLTSAGLKPASAGVVPTPAVSLAVRDSQAALGVVITASHNPAQDNGIKFFGRNGVKLTDADEARIEQLLPGAGGASYPGELPRFDAETPYARKAAGLLPAGALRGWKIVLDTANGAASGTSRTVLEQLGADLVLLGNYPDGLNINAGIGSQHPEKMCAAVLASGARLGVAHDGDADRCVLCDEAGVVLDGDEILTVLALHALREGRLVNRTLVVTVQSNLGVDAAVDAAGGRVCRSPVGDRYVIERMLAEGAMLGGESSGHVICREIAPTGDGLVAALKVIEVMRASGRPLSELRRSLRKFPQLSAALKVRAKIPMDQLRSLPAEVRSIEAELGGRGRVLVRYSGTELLLRLLVEGETDSKVSACLDRLASAARKDLEVL